MKREVKRKCDKKSEEKTEGTFELPLPSSRHRRPYRYRPFINLLLYHIQHLHLRQTQQVSYILENVPATASFPDLADSLGPPLIGHAELHGSASRRSTAFWTNVGARAPTQRSLDASSATWTAADLLRDTSFGLDYTSNELPRFFNKFMRRPDSHAHR